MRGSLRLKRLTYATMALIALAGAIGTANADDLPDYMKPIAGRTASTPAETATKNVLALNSSMFELYGEAAKVFQKNILANHPVILGLFSGAGGRFILYRPGQPPLDAPPVPIVYQLMKSVAHSTMALAEVVGPYLDNPDDQSWRGPMLAFRSRMKSALDGLDLTPMQPDWRDNSRIILQNNIAFMDECLTKGVVSFAALKAFSEKQAPYLKLNVAWAAQTQIGHWMGVIADWKKLLGERLGQDLRRKQHDLRRAPEQYAVQRAGAVLRSGCHQRPVDPHRDDVVHNHAVRDARIADPHHRRPFRRCAVLWQLLSDGLRTDGRRRTGGDHRGRRQAWNEAVPASAGAVRLQAVADPGHPGAGTRVDRRPSLKPAVGRTSGPFPRASRAGDEKLPARECEQVLGYAKR